ncbi:MAG: hypothetical protein ACO1PZ_14610 [Gammaproteobacteria bacterium]
MPPLYDWLESTAPGTWMREAPWAFPGALVVHVWALAFICGSSVVLALAVFGIAPRLLPALLSRFQQLLWPAFVISLISGLLLLMTYPGQVLASPVFYSKLVCIALALSLAVSLTRRLGAAAARNSTAIAIARADKLRAAGLLAAWFVALALGRLLYYTY